jgi:hypothetical protein
MLRCGRYTFSTLISVYSYVSFLPLPYSQDWADHTADTTDKWMFSADHYNLGFPLFVTSIHMVVQFVLSGLTLCLFPKLRSPVRPTARDYV